MDTVDQILAAIADLIAEGRFIEMETDALEIKSVPAKGHEWKRVHESVNAFLNTRGGVVILGIKEEQHPRRYVVSGWQNYAENNLKEFARQFTDNAGSRINLNDRFPPKQVREMPGGLGRVCIVYVDELAADQKYAFLDGIAYKRHLTQDVKLTPAEVEAQEDFRREAVNARELQPLPNLKLDSLDLEKLNQFIFQLNQPTPIETMKADLAQARPFLERRHFISGDAVTILGALVCAAHPNDCLGFRSQVHGYVDLPSSDTIAVLGQQIVKDKQDFVDNVLQLMELSLGYLLRNIQVGVVARGAGTSQPQYPTALLRETINNALAHRDYSIDKQVILTVKPGKHIAIQNPGQFRSQLLIESKNDPIPLYRIVPEAKPRNPKLADVLRVFRKWEGRGIGMATLVNLCLQNVMDIPYYRLLTEEVRLHVCAGRLLDERMDRHFESFDGYLEEKLNGSPPTSEQKLVLSYLIKSERHNQRNEYTILLTPDNNHFDAIFGLERAGLISKHPASTPNYPVYIADRVIVLSEFTSELRIFFGITFDGLNEFQKRLLGIVYRFEKYNKVKAVSAKQASYVLWYEDGEPGGIEQFDSHYRKVRYTINKLLHLGYVKREHTKRYRLNESYRRSFLALS